MFRTDRPVVVAFGTIIALIVACGIIMKNTIAGITRTVITGRIGMDILDYLLEPIEHRVEVDNPLTGHRGDETRVNALVFITGLLRNYLLKNCFVLARVDLAIC